MRVECEAVTPLEAGLAVLRVTAINDGDTTVEWPVRLHPSESTVAFVIDGTTVRGVEQIDSIVATVPVPPGQAVSTGVALRLDEITPAPALPDADRGGTIDVRVVVSPPGAHGEVRSSRCAVEVAEARDAADRGALERLDAAARAARNADPDTAGSSDDRDPAIAETLGSLDPAQRAWVATALLPAAPLADDVLLAVARRLGELEDRDDAVASMVLAGVPHPVS